MSIEFVVAIHPPFPWLVDWARLAASGARWFLITSEDSRARLESEQRTTGLERVLVARSFDVDGLLEIVAPLVRAASSPSSVRVATMIEPMQMPVSQLRRILDVPGAGPDEVLPFVDKLLMKAALRGTSAEVYLPRYQAHDREAFARDRRSYAKHAFATLGPSIFAKPVAQNSSLGTAKLNSEDELISFLDASPDHLELDEFVDGDGYHLDSVVVNGRVCWFGAGRYAAPQGDTLRGAPLAGISVTPRDPLYAELAAINDDVLGAFAHVPDGCTHMEFLRRRNGKWVFLEIAARVPGARLPEMHQLSRGVDLRVAHYSIHAGHPVDVSGSEGPHAAYYCPMKTEAGTVATMLAPEFESQHTVSWNASWLGRSDVARTMSMGDCLGYFVLWNEDRGVLERDLARMEGFRAYTLMPASP